MKKFSQRGFFLVEVVVVSAVVAVVLLLLVGSIQNSVTVSYTALERTQAAYLLAEGADAVKSIRDAGWSNITAAAVGTTYYLHWSGTAWTLVTAPENVDQFTRTVVFSSVMRGSSDDIVASGGTTDAGTRGVTVSVSWPTSSGSTSTETLPFYVMNI